MYKIFAVPVVWIIMTAAGYGQNIEFTASAPSEVSVGERFRFTYQLNEKPSDFSAPSFSGFRRLSGPNQSSSTSMQIINNKTTVTESYSYTYILEATEEGSFSIEPARVTLDGDTYRSNRVQITVRAATAAPGGQQPTSPDQPAMASAKDVFIRASANIASPYQGQQVIISYNIYTRIPVNQYSIEKLPTFRSFWSENVSAQGQPQTRTQVLNGETYRVAEIYRVAVFPQRSGELTVEPLEAELIVSLPGQRRGSLLDEFFGGSPFDQRRNIRQNVLSNPLTLNVKPLPTQNRPAAFTGMVGTDFDVKASVNHTELKANDAVNLKLTISGKGNMRMLQEPGLNFPHNLEVFDPNISDNINNSTSGISGSRSYEYVMIPRTGGEFTVPSWSFVYFDPVAQRYITEETPEFVLQVEGETAINGNEAGAPTQEAIKTLATDIRFIKTYNINLAPKNEGFFGSTLFWVLLILPFLLFAFFVIYWRNYIRLQSNYELLRTRRAEKVARKRLKKARVLMENKQENEFYDEIFRTLWGYLSDKLSIPVSILNKENVQGAFNAKKVPAELSESFIATLNDCEYARFAPGEKEDRMGDIYRKTLDTIVRLEKELKTKKD